jgi:hypothetical protein
MITALPSSRIRPPPNSQAGQRRNSQYLRTPGNPADRGPWGTLTGRPPSRRSRALRAAEFFANSRRDRWQNVPRLGRPGRLGAVGMGRLRALLPDLTIGAIGGPVCALACALLLLPPSAATAQPAGLNPGRDCQTIRTCNFGRQGSYRGCLSTYSCRVCRFVRSGCYIDGGRRVCQHVLCTWG